MQIGAVVGDGRRRLGAGVIPDKFGNLATVFCELDRQQREAAKTHYPPFGSRLALLNFCHSFRSTTRAISR